MSIAIIVAASENGVIGVQGGLPWSLPGDLRFFKAVTTGHPVIMGRTTWESIPPKFRPLVGRPNLVISRDKGYLAEGAKVMNSLEAALKAVAEEDAFIIGGASVYAESLSKGVVDCIFLTRVHKRMQGDAAFSFEEKDFKRVTESEVFWDEASGIGYSFELHVAKGKPQHSEGFLKIFLQHFGA